MDFKNSLFMYCLGGAIVIFVIAQSVFFLVKAWKHGKEIGISTQTLRNTVSSSVIFTVAPALAILATVITLAGALGLVVPWVRLSVIGNLTYEATAAQAAMEALGFPGISQEVTDKTAFATIAWVMTVGSIFPLVLLPIFLKKIQKKIGSVASGDKAKWADVMSSAAFIGLIGAFIARAVAGSGKKDVLGDGAGVLSVITLLFSIIFMLLIEFVCKKLKLKWLEPFAMPISMFAAMGMAMLFANVILPPDIAYLEWRN